MPKARSAAEREGVSWGEENKGGGARGSKGCRGRGGGGSSVEIMCKWRVVKWMRDRTVGVGWRVEISVRRRRWRRWRRKAYTGEWEEEKRRNTLQIPVVRQPHTCSWVIKLWKIHNLNVCFWKYARNCRQKGKCLTTPYLNGPGISKLFSHSFSQMLITLCAKCWLLAVICSEKEKLHNKIREWGQLQMQNHALDYINLHCTS